MITRPSALVVALLATSVANASGQTEIALEAGASQVRPPLGVAGSAARFLVGGLRASHYRPSGSGLLASVLVGRVTDEALGGDFVSGVVSGLLLEPLGHGWSAGLEARAFAFDVTTPFPYQAYAVEGGPQIRYSARAVSVRLRGKGGIGNSRVELRRRLMDRVLTVEDELWRLGGSAEVLFGSGSVLGGLEAGAHKTPGGTYTTGGARVVWAALTGAAEFRVSVWRTPLGTETTGGLGFSIPVGRWSIRGFAGRSEPDPLTLAEPGGGSGGVLIGRTLVRGGSTLPDPATLATVLADTPSGARVRIAVTPSAAQSVQVLGDFSAWEPITMTRDGQEWVVDLDIVEGTHHFGFLVDGEWFVPEDAPDVVSDDWGRTNATLVIER
jgi:AMP-activated protein kinase-like protein